MTWLALARAALGESADLRQLTLPGDPLPPADAVVSVGHVLSYLPDAAAVGTALAAAADAGRRSGTRNSRPACVRSPAARISPERAACVPRHGCAGMP